jgi:hypothetical protein
MTMVQLAAAAQDHDTDMIKMTTTVKQVTCITCHDGRGRLDRFGCGPEIRLASQQHLGVHDSLPLGMSREPSRRLQFVVVLLHAFPRLEGIVGD